MLRGLSLSLLIVVAGLASAAGPQSPAPHGVVLYSPTAPGGSVFGWAIATLDVNGDGFGDAAVSDRVDGAGAVFIFLGGASGFSTTPTYTIRGASLGDQFGDGLAAVGDVDGDKRDDLAVGAPYARGLAGEPYSGRVYLFRASSLKASTTIEDAALTLYASSDQARLGMKLAGGADATGDGIRDLLVGEPFSGYGYGAVYLVSGALTGNLRITEAASAWVRGESISDGLGSHGLTFVNDVTSDGRAEWAVGSPRYNTNDAGRVYLITSKPQGVNVKNASHRFWDGAAASDNFGFALGMQRLTSTQQRIVVGSSGADGTNANGGRAYLITPTAANGSAALRAVTTIKGFDSGATGSSLAMGDFNGDLVTDVVMGSPMAQVNSATPGEIGFLLGPLPTGIFSAADFGARVTGDYNSGRFGHAVAIVVKPTGAHSAGILAAAYKGTLPRVHLLLNQAPTALASIQEIPCTGSTTPVLLNATGTSDPDGPADIWKITWTQIAPDLGRVVRGVGQTLPVQLGVGRHTFEVSVIDNYLATGAPFTSTATVFDRELPALDLKRPNGGVLYLDDTPLLDVGGVVPAVKWATHVDSVTLRANATDVCSPIDRVEFLVEDRLVFVDREAPFEMSYDPHEFWPAFKHVFARAYDAAGNGPAEDCVHVVNTAWLDLHHLPVGGGSPPPDALDTLFPDPLGHVVASDVHCDEDGTDDVLPDLVHPLGLPEE